MVVLATKMELRDVEAAKLAALVDRVQRGEEIAIVRDGRVVMRLLPPPKQPDEPGAQRLVDVERLRARLLHRFPEPLPGPSNLEIVQAMREDR